MSISKKITIILCMLIGIFFLVILLLFSACNTQAQSKDESKIPDELGVPPIYQMPQDDFAIAMNEHRDYLILVNEDHPYEFGDLYDQLLQDDIIYVADCNGEPTPVEKAAYLAFTELQADLHAQGIEIALYSAYRTEADQQWVVDHYSNLKGWSETNKVMEPGFSEHHTGLMIEFVVWYNGGDKNAKWEWTTVTAERAKDPYFEPIWASLANRGFILRYPKSKESITKVPYEPYELRFVGSSNVAVKIMGLGLCLEEYLDTDVSSSSASSSSTDKN